MSVLFLFSIALISWAAQPGDSSTPYKNAYYVACGSDQQDCVQGKCVMLGRGTTLCTECKSGKVPIDGKCVGAGDPDLLVDINVCNPERSDNGGTRCKSCNDEHETSGKGTKFFLFYGGCYDKTWLHGPEICKTVVDNMCTDCATEHGYVFTNSGANTNEKCILCGDTAGFGGRTGLADCATCVPSSQSPSSIGAVGAAVIQCTSCSTGDNAPIDGQCAACGPHRCEDGHCTHCAVGYVYHKGGCYSRDQEGKKTCAGSDLLEIGGYSACKKCANSDETPHNGNCRPTGDRDNCKKDTSNGRCTDCNQNNPGSTVFLYEGGCYNITDPLGGTICTEAFGGRCTACNELQGYFKKGTGCESCAAVIADCARCSPRPSASDTPICTGCKNNKHAVVGGTSCAESCPPPTIPDCDDGICRCTCGPGTYLDTGKNSCEACDMACANCTGPGPDSCIPCTSGTYTKADDSGRKTCVDPFECGDGHYADNDSRTCAPCGISSCKSCDRKSSGIRCTACSSGYLSTDGSSCVSQCNEPNQEKGDGNKCVCRNGFGPDSAGRCVPTSSCRPQNTGCSSCDAAGDCLSCSDSTYSVQPNKQSCALGCPDGSESFASFCACVQGYTLRGGACVPQAKRAGSVPIAVGVSASVVGVVAIALVCWFVLRRRQGQKGVPILAGTKRLMGSVDEF
ncbi:High cysteine membrane protein Group 1 [Giardia lamblia P15]|uniref:High cysteine membrane protein Group 1 n=1 Tax=Giardia intestinalis (strain P15) TaxID=658858 RepID=E1F8R8_GIAIA|nr:High cysteine membrane protein Group 1 [Giardia lamblia P15]